MKKKGFTLVELIAVIILLGALSLIIIPIVNNSLTKNKEKLYENQLKSIEEAASKWAYNNLELLPSDEGEAISITLLILKQNGHVAVDVKDPRSGNDLPNDMIITITFRNNNYIYAVDDESGTGSSEYSQYIPNIILNGSILEYIEVNSSYNEKNVVAIDYQGQELDSVNIKYDKLNTSISESYSTVYTDSLGTYLVTYTATTVVSGITYSSKIIRTVIVRDTTPPELTIPADITITQSEAMTFDLMNGVVYSDNSLGTVNVNVTGFDTSVGKKTVTYTAIDPSGNTTAKKRYITIQ